MTPPATPSLAPAGPLGARGERLRVALVGANAWLVCGVIPVAQAAGHPLGAIAALGLGLVVLAAGVLALGRERSATVAGWLLLALFPALLALGLALPIELHAPEALSPGVAVFGAVAFVAYGMVAARAVARPPGTRASTRHALTATPRAREDVGKLVARRALLAVVAIAALGLVAVAPFAEAGQLVRAFPGAPGEAAVMATVVGGVLASLLAGALLGPGLRAARVARPVVGRALVVRVLTLFGVAVLGVVAYLVWRVAQ